MKIQKKLQAAVAEIGTLRIAADILKSDDRFGNISHVTLIRWINMVNPSLLLVKKMERAVAILSPEVERRKPKLTNPHEKMVRKALADTLRVSRTLKTILKQFQ